MTTPPATDARRVFRGPIATLLFPLVGAAAGAAVALIAGPPSLYSSSGLIGLPAGPALEEGDTGLRAGASLAVNDRVLEDLIVIAHSPRVHDLALLDPVWKTMGRPPSPAAVGERLKATREAGGFVRPGRDDHAPASHAGSSRRPARKQSAPGRRRGERIGVVVQIPPIQFSRRPCYNLVSRPRNSYPSRRSYRAWRRSHKGVAQPC